MVAFQNYDRKVSFVEFIWRSCYSFNDQIIKK